MKIYDSLRQEHMPDMVYTLCKLTGSRKLTPDELMKYITLNDADKNDKSRDNFNRVMNFAKECEFIQKEADGTLSANFVKKDLESFRRFRLRVFLNVNANLETKFTGIAKWYLNQDKDIFSVKKPEDFMARVPQKYGVTKYYILGFFFWMEALGLTNIFDIGSGRKLYFAIHEILTDWIKIEKPFTKGKTILMKDFVETLVSTCPIFNETFSNNNVNFAMSAALRTLDASKIIKLKYSKDSGDVWHLVSSAAYQDTNSITEIEVL